MNSKVKIYGKTVNTWMVREQFTDWNGKQREREVIAQYEIEFTEYNLDGSISRKGTEDFSKERYNKVFKKKWVYTWDGQKLNKGGKRRFEDHGMIQYSTEQAKEVKQFLTNKYHAELLQLR